MTPTLTDVARRAGVSLSTASRAFSNPDRIGPESLRKIQTAAEELGYSGTTRSPAQTRSLAIAVIVPDIGNPVWADFVKAAQTQGFYSRNSLVLVDTDGSPEHERTLIADLTERVDGFIICSPRNSADQIVELCAGMPLVLVNRSSDDCPCVVTDSEIGLRQAIDYLHALGHSHLAYVQGSPHSWSNERRVTAVQQLTEDRGMTLSLLGWQSESLAGGHASAASIIASGASAVITHNDPMALGAINGLDSLGVRVPEDISVIGIDGSPWIQLTHPNLTTIQVPMARSAVVSTDLLQQALADDQFPAQLLHLPTQLVVRNTSGPAPHRTVYSPKDLES